MRKLRDTLLSLILILSMTSPFNHGILVNAESHVTNFANLVLFVQFPETKGNFMTSAYTDKAVRYYTDTTYPKSLVSYMNTISYGMFHVETYIPQLFNNVIQPIVLDNSRTFYTDDHAVSKEVLGKAKTLIQANTNLDFDNDGFVDNITLIFAGDSGERLTTFYAHKFSYDAPDDLFNNKSVGTINIQMGDDLFGTSTLSGPGVIAHEFMHSLGYPDLYHETGGDPVASWDIMAQATIFMSWPLAYLRSWKSQWLNIDTITKNQTNVTLVPSSKSSGNRAYILKTELSDTEFFVVEYRQKSSDINNGLDYKIPGSGLIVYRINTNTNNLTNRAEDKPDGVYVFRQGETTVTAATFDNLKYSFFSKESGRTSFGSADLNAKISDNALVYSDGQNSGIVLSNIGSAGDTISFDVSFADTSNVGIWNNLGSAVLSQSDSGVLDTAVNGTSVYPNVLLGNYSDDLNNRIAVYGFDGTSWGAVTSSITDYSYGSHLVYYQGVPYVLYSDINNKLKLVRYINKQWETVKNDFTSNAVSDSALTVSTDGLYVAFNDGTNGTNGYTVKIYKYSSQKFTLLYNSGDGYYSQMHMSASGADVYLSCRDYTKNSITNLFSIKDSTVKQVPVPTEKSADSEICTDGTNLYLLILASDTNTADLYKYSADCSSYSKLGTGLSIANAAIAAITVYKNVPLVQIIDTDSTSQKYTTIWRNDSGIWTKEGYPVLRDEADLSSVVMIGNECYAAVVFNSVPYVKHKTITVQESRTDTEPVVTNLSVEANKSNYVVGESFSASDITVRALLSNMDSKILDSKEYKINGFDTTSTGTKNVTVQYGTSDIEATYQIVVSSSLISAIGIELDKSSLMLNTGSTSSLTATVSPSDASNKNVTWSSSDNTVAAVDQTGRVTALKAGTATITATTEDGGKTATCTVTVNQPVTGAEIGYGTSEIGVGDSASFGGHVLPFDATNQKISWKSSDDSIVSIDNEGIATAHKVGTVTLTLTTEEGGYTATCTVTVTQPVTGISLNKASLTLIKGSSETLTATVTPASASPTVTWKSSNAAVATVLNGKVTAIGLGKAVITATNTDGRTAQCTVNVLTPVQGFVYRLYDKVLGREPDTAGLNNWVGLLESRKLSGSEVAYDFFFSDEFKNKNYCDAHFTEYVYNALMGRGSDPAGYENWMGYLYRGTSRESVINGFLLSPEFTAICASYGITRGNGVAVPAHGTVQTGPCTADSNIDTGMGEFVVRLYKVCLGRGYDTAGLKNWITQLNNGESGSAIAHGFFFSPELQNKHLSNGEYVTTLYETMFNRQPDGPGLADWTGQLNRGASRESVYQGFAGSQEWSNTCGTYGITK